MVHFVSCLLRIAEKHGFSSLAEKHSWEGPWFGRSWSWIWLKVGMFCQGLISFTVDFNLMIMIYWLVFVLNPHVEKRCQIQIHTEFSWKYESPTLNCDDLRSNTSTHRTIISTTSTALGLGRRPWNRLGSVGFVSQAWLGVVTCLNRPWYIFWDTDSIQMVKWKYIY